MRKPRVLRCFRMDLQTIALESFQHIFDQFVRCGLCMSGPRPIVPSIMSLDVLSGATHLTGMPWQASSGAFLGVNARAAAPWAAFAFAPTGDPPPILLCANLWCARLWRQGRPDVVAVGRPPVFHGPLFCARVVTGVGRQGRPTPSPPPGDQGSW